MGVWGLVHQNLLRLSLMPNGTFRVWKLPKNQDKMSMRAGSTIHSSLERKQSSAFTHNPLCFRVSFSRFVLTSVTSTRTTVVTYSQNSTGAGNIEDKKESPHNPHLLLHLFMWTPVTDGSRTEDLFPGCALNFPVAHTDILWGGTCVPTMRSLH